jgi:uncharacterized protein with PIN domain
MNSKMKKELYDDLMKPMTMKCGNCGGVLHVIPFEEKIGNRTVIKTFNICGKCTK